MKSKKVYIDVLAAFDPDGRIVPVQFRWTDGRKYQIDKVIDIRPAPSLKAP